MALYIKANPLVAEHLKVDKIRLKLSDGNYLLWQADMNAFGRPYEIPQICQRIGALALQPWEARQEQDGSVIRKLPVATDERFILPEPDPEDEVVEDMNSEQESEVSDE